MTEEKVTLSIIRSLKANGWKILSFDYPQSGTGKLIKPTVDEKNLGSFIPDIVSLKNGIVLFWENKDKFVFNDFDKIKKLKTSTTYLKAIKEYLLGNDYIDIFFGVGIPNKSSEMAKATQYYDLIDFLVVTNGLESKVIYNKTNSNIV